MALVTFSLEWVYGPFHISSPSFQSQDYGNFGSSQVTSRKAEMKEWAFDPQVQ